MARRRVITIHDLTYKRFPELLQKETLENLERQMTREIAIADAIICVSESTRRDLLRYYDVDPVARVRHPLRPRHAGDGRAVRRSARALHPLRQHDRAAQGPRHADRRVRAAARQRRVRRIAGGGREGRMESRSRSCRACADAASCISTTSAPSQLATVYEHAEAFVFPSIYEGFGFPLLEAMARGVPSIAARSSSLPEIGGDAALYFEPGERRRAGRATHARAERRDAARRPRARGRERAAEFRWEVAAAETLAVLRRAAE